MIIKNLKIINAKQQKIIRDLDFSKTINFIVDRTIDTQKETGNNVGKTTILKLIDVCLGADPSIVYKNRGSKSDDINKTVKSFLINEKVEIELTLNGDGQDTTIKRNFLPRREAIIRINEVNYTFENFKNKLKEILFPKIVSEKPTIRELIPRIMRYSEEALRNPLEYLPSKKLLEYEAIYLNMFGLYTGNIDKVDLDEKIINEEKFIKKVSDGLKKMELLFSIKELEKEIDNLKSFNSKFDINENYNFDVKELNDIKSKINNTKNKISSINSKISFQKIALNDLVNEKAILDTKNIKAQYNEVKKIWISFTKLLMN